MPTLSVIIVSYNTRDLTLECLRTLYADLNIAAEVFVVDNASTDNSPAAIRAAFPQVILIESPDNKGFGAANNFAFARAAGKYFLLLNSDAFPKPGAIQTLIDFLEQDPKTALVGPRLLNTDGSLQLSCFKFLSPYRAWVENLWLSALAPNHPTIGDYRRWPHDQVRNVDWVIGACLLVRADVVKQAGGVGGFDETFFMYAEESDWQHRIRNAGWNIAFTPNAQVTHLGGASNPNGPDGGGAKPRINPTFFDSLDIYERKHHGFLGLLSLRLAMVIGCSMRLVLWCVAFFIRPSRRPFARAKIKLLAWLVFRQATHWHNPSRTAASAIAPQSPAAPSVIQPN